MTISVAMPTYRRLPQLQRAVADVQAQSWKDWELIISDDEKEPGETWAWLQELAAKDPRVRVVRNTGEIHGQIWNVNNALRQCTGDWIKPFFDDDRMLPNCLEEFARCVDQIQQSNNPTIQQFPIVLIGARAQSWRNGVHVCDEADFTTHELEAIPDGATARLAMCLYDTWNGRTPTHMLIRGDVVRAGAMMVEDKKFKHPIDVRWFGRILEHGGVAFTNKVLVAECQGEVASGTSELWKEEGYVTEQIRQVYAEIYNRAKDRGETRGWPSLRSIDAEICGVRGLYHLKMRQWRWAARYLFFALLHPTGWPKVVRWLRAKRSPGHYTATERVKV